MYIAISGNIGAGKTTLTRLLSKEYNWKPSYETIENNPYLADFYEDMKRWSFALQIHFLQNRFQRLLHLQSLEKVVIQDRTIYEDAEIFALNLVEMNLMEKRDFNNYKAFYDILISLVKPPDLLIYLKAKIPTIIGRIQKRGRAAEESIRLDYLESLNKKYDNWIKNYNLGKLLIINVDDLDFLERREDLNIVINKIEASLHGLF